MNKKRSIIVALLMTVVLLVAIGVVWYHGAKNFLPHVSITRIATTTPSPVNQALSGVAPATISSSSTIVPSSSVACGTDFSDFTVPSLPSSSIWTKLTPMNATSVYVTPQLFSSSTGEVIYPDAFNTWPANVNISLPGNEWFSSQGSFASVDGGYYQSILQKDGWIYQTNVGGYQINAEQAAGFHGESNGYIKIKNGYFRSIVLYYLTGAPYSTHFIVYVSDIVPLSQIIPSYQPNCPGVWLTSIKQTSPEVVSVPSSSTIPDVIRGRVVFVQKGEVSVSDQDGGNELQLTHTNGSVGDSESIADSQSFSFSPDFHYLEYYIIWPAGSRDYSTGTIVILDLATNQVVQKINGLTPDQLKVFSSTGAVSNYISFQNWVNNDQFIYLAWSVDEIAGGGADVTGHLLVDLQKGTTTVIQPQ